MAEQQYDPKKLALELGFSEDDAERFGEVNANATNLRRLAETRREKAVGDAIQRGTVGTLVDPDKKHKHFYRKDGTCVCGAVKGVKPTAEQKAEKAKRDAEVKAEAEAVKARADAEAEADNRPAYQGQAEPPAPESQAELDKLAAEHGETVPPTE